MAAIAHSIFFWLCKEISWNLFNTTREILQLHVPAHAAAHNLYASRPS